MIQFVIRRIASGLVTVFLIITVAFFLIRLAPGGPFDDERSLPPDVEARIMATYHLDEPLFDQYVRYVLNLAKGDLGPSFKYRDKSVNDIIADGLPISLKLGVTALVTATLLGCLIGAVAAVRHNTRLDYILMMGALLGIAVPAFVVAPMLALAFGVHLQWLPVAGWGGGDLQHMLLPVIALTLPHMAVIARLMRAGMIEILQSNFIRTAKAKGVPPHLILWRHALRGSIIPVVTYLGPATAGILTGSVVIEQIFSLPGIGRFFVQGALNRDYTLVMGMVVLFGAFLVVANLIVDIVYGILNPRVRYD